MFAAATVQFPAIDPRVIFWSDQSQWPNEGLDHRFFARALHRVAGFVFKDQWTGAEPTTIGLQPIRAQLDTLTREHDIREATNILYHCHAGYRDRAQMALANSKAAPLPSPDEWLVAFTISQQISDQTWAAVHRFDQVLCLMELLFESGMVVAAVRDHDFGYPQPIPPQAWLNECRRAWFATCQIDQQRPYSKIPVRQGGRWLYVHRESLEVWIQSAFSPTIQHNQSGSAAPNIDQSTAQPSDDPANQTEDTHNDKNVVQPDASDLTQDEQVPTESGSSAREEAASVSPKPKRGRKPRFDWPSFDCEIINRLKNCESPKSVHAFADEMLEWCSVQWPEEPSESSVRLRITQFLATHGLKLD